MKQRTIFKLMVVFTCIVTVYILITSRIVKVCIPVSQEPFSMAVAPKQTHTNEPSAVKQYHQISRRQVETTEDKLKHRRAVLQERCQVWRNVSAIHNADDLVHLKHIVVDEGKKILACIIPKVGCTNMLRVFLYLGGIISREEVHSLSGYETHFKLKYNLKYLRDYSATKRNYIINNYKKIVFVRNPLERFVSGYKNKLFHPDKKERGKFINEMASFYSRKSLPLPEHFENGNVSFLDWTRYTVDKVKAKEKLNPHFAPYLEICKPCLIPYEYIGKFETIANDTSYIFKTLGIDVSYPQGQRKSANLVSRYFSQLPVELFKQFVDIFKSDFSLFDFGNPDWRQTTSERL